MIEGIWWEDADSPRPGFQLTAERLTLVPWSWFMARQSRPPSQSRSRSRGRLCELCGLAYRGDRECEGAARCPRYFGARRHELEWHQGYWVPARLVAEWRVADAAARAREVGSGARPAGPAGPPAKRPHPMAAACGVALLRNSLQLRAPPRPPPVTGGGGTKQPQTRAQLVGYTEEQVTQAGRRAEREPPLPVPLSSAFTGQDDTVVAPDESEDVDVISGMGAELDTVAPELRPHVGEMAQGEAETEMPRQTAREQRKAPPPQEGD